MSTEIAKIVLADVKKFTYEEIMQSNPSKVMADACADKVIEVITINFKNRSMYIPTGLSIENDKIHKAICTDFNGNNHAKLAIKYKRSLQNVYKILKSENNEQAKRPITIEVIEDYIPVELIAFGLSKDLAESLAKKIAYHLQKNFPGISICPGTASNGK